MPAETNPLLGPQSSIATTIPTFAALGFVTQSFANGLRMLPPLHKLHHHLVCVGVGGVIGYFYTQFYNHQLTVFEYSQNKYLERRQKQRETIEKYHSEQAAA